MNTEQMIAVNKRVESGAREEWRRIRCRWHKGKWGLEGTRAKVEGEKERGIKGSGVRGADTVYHLSFLCRVEILKSK